MIHSMFYENRSTFLDSHLARELYAELGEKTRDAMPYLTYLILHGVVGKSEAVEPGDALWLSRERADSVYQIFRDANVVTDSASPHVSDQSQQSEGKIYVSGHYGNEILDKFCVTWGTGSSLYSDERKGAVDIVLFFTESPLNAGGAEPPR